MPDSAQSDDVKGTREEAGTLGLGTARSLCDYLTLGLSFLICAKG